MKYEIIRRAAIYTFICVTVAMTLLGVLAVWGLVEDDVIGRSFATVLVVGFGSIVIAYASSLLERREEREALPSFAPHPPKPVPPPNHLAQNHEGHNHG